MNRQHRLAFFLPLLLSLLPLAAQAGRPIAPEDWYRFQDVSDLQISPDGAAVVYLVTSYDRDSDESRGAVWLADWAGTQGGVQLTRGQSASEPRFSPDGRYVSFLSARDGQEHAQLWLIDRRGGEPRAVSRVSGEITGYEWSPDGKRVVLVMRGADSPCNEPAGKEATSHKSPQPYVIDAYHFKQDREGYLTAQSRTHLYLLEADSGRCMVLTADPQRADSAPAFAPDGRSIAFVSNQVVDQKDAGRDDIEVVEAQAGAVARKVASVWSPNHQHLQWSPDGTRIALLLGDELRFNAYIMDRLAVLDPATGAVRELTASLDRAVVSPRFSDGGAAVSFAVEDDGYQYPARVQLASGSIERLGGPMVVNELATAAGHTVVLAADERTPTEVYALEGGKLRALSAHNRALFAELELGAVEDISFRSRDGTEIHGQVVKPPGYVPGRRYPAILWIHGGPNGQDDHSIGVGSYGPPLERQLFASHGYVVIGINYRGSTGRGAAFARSIRADWGHKEVEDLLAGIDHVVGSGLADPERLGIGGWSYGGILTDYTIASTPRFRAAIAGAGSANQISMYGVDEYVVQYDAELGPPWRNTPLWMRLSYPFFHADRIRTPTLFLGGDRDANVPIVGGEQMYQALRTLGVPTGLVVYPDEFHSFTRPSFLVDCFSRYLGWMEKYLGAAR